MNRILVMIVLIIAGQTFARADFVRAKGRVMFVDSDGVTKPFARVQVRLMDSDSDYDEEIARGFTDADGKYTLEGSAGDSPCVGCGKPDPYVKVVLEDPGRVEVHDILSFTRNAVLTPTHEETAGEINFGTRTFTKAYPEGMAAILYVRAQRAYDRFKALSGDAKVPGNGGEVAVEIPVVLSAGIPYTTWDTIHWPGVMKAFDVFDHEFGHRLRHAADGSVTHFNNDLVWYRYARHHHPDEDTNLGFAFNEGWAHYFRNVMQPDHMNDPWNGVNKGDEVEGHVARKLISLSNKCGGFRHMWKALKNNPGEIHSFQEFYDAFISYKPPCSINIPINNAPGGQPHHAPVADSNIVAIQLDQLKKHIDAIDARSAAGRGQAALRIPSSIRTQDQSVVIRLWQKQLASAEGADMRARVAYRYYVSGLQPATPDSLQDGSYKLDANAARHAFITAVAEPRLHEAQELRRDIAAELMKTRDEALRSYLARLDAKYARLEEELKKALAVRDGKATKLPLGVLPRSFSGAR